MKITYQDTLVFTKFAFGSDLMSGWCLVNKCTPYRSARCANEAFKRRTILSITLLALVFTPFLCLNPASTSFEKAFNGSIVVSLILTALGVMLNIFSYCLWKQGSGKFEKDLYDFVHILHRHSLDPCNILNQQSEESIVRQLLFASKDTLQKTCAECLNALAYKVALRHIQYGAGKEHTSSFEEFKGAWELFRRFSRGERRYQAHLDIGVKLVQTDMELVRTLSGRSDVEVPKLLNRTFDDSEPENAIDIRQMADQYVTTLLRKFDPDRITRMKMSNDADVRLRGELLESQQVQILQALRRLELLSDGATTI